VEYKLISCKENELIESLKILRGGCLFNETKMLLTPNPYDNSLSDILGTLESSQQESQIVQKRAEITSEKQSVYYVGVTQTETHMFEIMYWSTDKRGRKVYTWCTPFMGVLYCIHLCSIVST